MRAPCKVSLCLYIQHSSLCLIDERRHDSAATPSSHADIQPFNRLKSFDRLASLGRWKSLKHWPLSVRLDPLIDQHRPIEDYPHDTRAVWANDSPVASHGGISRLQTRLSPSHSVFVVWREMRSQVHGKDETS